MRIRAAKLEELAPKPRERALSPRQLAALQREEEIRKALGRLAPFTLSLASIDGVATAYVCVDYACRLPTTDPKAFAAQLDERASTAGERKP